MCLDVLIFIYKIRYIVIRWISKQLAFVQRVIINYIYKVSFLSWDNKSDSIKKINTMRNSWGISMSQDKKLTLYASK